jgi:hypothetical protein
MCLAWISAARRATITSQREKGARPPIRAPGLTIQCRIGFQPVSGCPARHSDVPTSFAADKISHKRGLIGPGDRLEAYVPLGRGYFLVIPGTSCLATIVLSLRDKNYSPIEAPRIILALMGFRPGFRPGFTPG